jgi:hypothetical protein
MKLFKNWLVCVSAAIIMVSDAAAQAWDAPMYFNPRPMDDIGLYFTRTNRTSGGDANGLIGIWRQSGNLNLGVRAGVGDLEDAGGTVLVGAELYGPLNRLIPASGLDIAWLLGAGAVFGSDYTLFSIPLGVSIGLRLGTGGVSIQPHVLPRVAFDVAAFDIDGEEVTETDGSVAIDVGADVNIGSSFILRVAWSIADRDAYGVGLALRWPRPVSVGSGR